MDDLLQDFLVETGEHLDTVDAELVRFERDPSDRDILRNIFRLLHTVKGTCGFLGLPRIERLAHAAETLMERLRGGQPATGQSVTLILAAVDRLKAHLAAVDRLRSEPPGTDADLIERLERETKGFGEDDALGSGEDLRFEASPESADERSPASGRSATVRVGVETLEGLMTTVSELVLTRNQLLDMARRGCSADQLGTPLQRLLQVTAELQGGVMKARMHPIGGAWAKFPRLVRDLGRELGKSIHLAMDGADTELDRQILELIRDPLTHLVRNAADHGVEPREERVASGKPPGSTIRLKASQEGGTVLIEVSDDGRGLDFAAIRRRAVQDGLVSATDATRLTDGQIGEFVFQPGLTTTRSISALSGRGIGLDVVKTNIASIGGTVDVLSRRGAGTTFRIRIPLTLSIVRAVIVRTAGQAFAIPQIAVREFVRSEAGGDNRTERLSGQSLMRLRDDLLPVVDLGALLELRPAPVGEDAFVVVMQVGRQRFGLAVDAIVEAEEIVVKPLNRRLRSVQLFSGNTILGDGTVVLIVDPNGIAVRAGAEISGSPVEAEPAAAPEDEEAETLLLFRTADGATKALPLSLVSRLEEVDAATIERIGPDCFVQYRGSLMPVVPADRASGIRREGSQPLVVLSDGQNAFALAVDEIVDILDAVLEVERLPSRPDLIGTAIVRGRATEILDVLSCMPGGRDGWGGGTAAKQAESTVLLVDDNPFFRDMLTPVLKAAGFRVRTAANTADGLRILSTQSVDAVVADIDPAGRTGFDLVEAVRGHPRTGALPVIALASGPRDAMLRRARELDVFDVVSKFDRSGLLAALAESAASPYGAAA